MSDKGTKLMDYMEVIISICSACISSSDGVLKQHRAQAVASIHHLSCPDEPILEVNIRVNPSPHSWTNDKDVSIVIRSWSQSTFSDDRTYDPNHRTLSSTLRTRLPARCLLVRC